MPILDDTGSPGAPMGTMSPVEDVRSAPSSVATPAPSIPAQQVPTQSPEDIAHEQMAQKALQIQDQFSGKITNMLKSITNGADTDAYFFDPKTDKVVLTRDFIEMILQDYGQASQNMAYLQKFVQIDSKLDKALREYRVDIQSLLASILNAPPTTLAK